jgi:hypothetical protein
MFSSYWLDQPNVWPLESRKPHFDFDTVKLDKSVEVSLLKLPPS